MWWNSDTDTETYRTVQRLNEEFLNELRSERVLVEVVRPAGGPAIFSRRESTSAVYGVGSTISRVDGKRVPMLAIDQAYAPSGDHPSRLWRSLTRANLFFGKKETRETRRRKLLVPFSKVDDDLRRVLKNWDIPDETEVFFTPAPRATAAEPGSRVWADRRDATIGFSLGINHSRIAVSTAGHLVPDFPFPVEERRSGWFGDKVERIGAALFSHDPTDGTPGVDVAVIELRSQPAPGRRYVQAVLAQAPLVSELSKVIVYGGKSGARRGWILGQMLSMRAIGGRIWSNCWTIVENSGGLVQQGDSGGSAILLGSNEVLGHVVAAMGTERGNGRRQVGLVQDMRTIIDYVERDYAQPVRVLSGNP
jgi:hypothetical protein